MTYRILLPIDESERRSTAQAEAVAALPGAAEATVTLLHVFDEETADAAVTDLKSAAAVDDVLSAAGVSFDPLATTGDPAEAIRRVADEVDADCIVLGGRKRSGLGSLLFGSVTRSVTLATDRPVTVTGRARTDEEAGATGGVWNVKFFSRNARPNSEYSHTYHGIYSYEDAEGQTHNVERRFFVFTGAEGGEAGRPRVVVEEDDVRLTPEGQPHEIVEQTEREFTLDVSADATDYAIESRVVEWHEDHLETR
jgi:nucleotide-binding universal stress UspA family protein